jgi:hypothetical protein
VRIKNDGENLKGYSLILENFVGFALVGWHKSNFGNKAICGGCSFLATPDCVSTVSTQAKNSGWIGLGRAKVSQGLHQQQLIELKSHLAIADARI